jgi:uncharacterized protein (DUF1015 family)
MWLSHKARACVMKYELLPFNAYCAWGYPLSFTKILDKQEYIGKKTDIVTENLEHIHHILSDHPQDTCIGSSLFLLHVTTLRNESFIFFIGLMPFIKHKIYKHEYTDKSKVSIYEDLMNRHHLQISPIMLLTQHHDIFDRVANDIVNAQDPIRTYHENDHHYALYRCDDPLHIDEIKQCINTREKFFLADGHHRFAFFVKHAKEYPLCMSAITTIQHQKMTVCPRIAHISTMPAYPDIIAVLSHYFSISPIENLDSIDPLTDYAIVFETYLLKATPLESFKPTNKLESFSSYIADAYIIYKGFVRDIHHAQEIKGMTACTFETFLDVFSTYNKHNAVMVLPPFFDKNLLIEHAADDFYLPSTSTLFTPKIPEGLVIYDLHKSRIP